MDTRPKALLIAIERGGDWYDASVRYLKLSEPANAEDLYREYRAEVLHPGRGNRAASFEEWLQERGARDAHEEELQSFNPDYCNLR